MGAFTNLTMSFRVVQTHNSCPKAHMRSHTCIHIYSNKQLSHSRYDLYLRRYFSPVLQKTRFRSTPITSQRTHFPPSPKELFTTTILVLYFTLQVYPFHFSLSLSSVCKMLLDVRRVRTSSTAISLPRVFQCVSVKFKAILLKLQTRAAPLLTMKIQVGKIQAGDYVTARANVVKSSEFTLFHHRVFSASVVCVWCHGGGRLRRFALVYSFCSVLYCCCCCVIYLRDGSSGRFSCFVFCSVFSTGARACLVRVQSLCARACFVSVDSNKARTLFLVHICITTKLNK